MLFRRASEHMKSQNWTAVAIDFLIVVLGVFVAIQVSNWNDTRLLKIQGATLTEQLLDDLSYEEHQYHILIDYYRGIRDNAKNVTAVLNGKSVLTDESFLIAAYRATQFASFPHARATYDELKSTGTIALIKDRRIRNLATTLFDNIFDPVVTEVRGSDYRNIFHEVIPNDVQYALSRSCGDRTEIDTNGLLTARDIIYVCTLDLPSKTISDAANALRIQPGLIGLLRRRIASIESSLATFEMVTELTTRINP